MNIKRLRKKHADLLTKGRGLYELAEKEDRNFTDKEWGELHRLDADVADVVGEIAKAEADSDLSDQLKQMFGGTAVAGGTGGRGQQNGGGWSRNFLKEMTLRSGFGRKALLPPSGSVTISTMLPTVGELTDTQRITSLLELIPRQIITVDTVSYLRETVRTHAAQPVGVGDKKPTSTYELERVDDRVRTIAHLSEPISRNWLADAPMLRAYLDGVLREGLILELEAQILQGTGLVEDFEGITNTAGVQIVTWDTDILRTARTAITALEVLPVIPDAWVIHPEDWETFELSVDLQGQYQMDAGGAAPPVDRAARRLWGLPVALSVGCSEGTAICAASRTATHLWLRQDVRIDWSEAFLRETDAYETATGFESNMVQFRAELRAAFGVPRPSAICLVELTGS